MISEEKKKKKSCDDTNNPWRRKSVQENEDQMRLWGILLFSLIGATATTFAVVQLRRTVDWFYTQLNRSESSWRHASSSSNRTSFKEEAWNRYNRQMQEEYEEEMQRAERIRRMQSVFNRERSRYKRSYENWRENGPGAYQHFQRDENWRENGPGGYGHFQPDLDIMSWKSYSLSHHYSVFGLDRSRARPYSDAEIKTAFRMKAKEYHPDQNQNNKEAAEAKFKEIMKSYEAIKLERRNMKS